MEINIKTKTDNRWYPQFHHFYNWDEAVDFMRKNIDQIEWWPFSCDNKIIPENIYREFKDYIPMQNYVMYNKISKQFVREFDKSFDWYHWIIYNKRIGSKLLDEFRDKWEWRNIAMHQHLSSDFIKRYKEEINKVFYLMIEFNKTYSPAEQYEIQMALK